MTFLENLCRLRGGKRDMSLKCQRGSIILWCFSTLWPQGERGFFFSRCETHWVIIQIYYNQGILCNQGPISSSCLSTQRCLARSNFAYQNKVNRQTTMLHECLPFLTAGTLLILLSRMVLWNNFCLKQLQKKWIHKIILFWHVSQWTWIEHCPSSKFLKM